jgi:hypothetical protein
MKYIIVIHSWFVDSKGWEVKEITASDLKEAKKIAKEMAWDKNSAFNRTDFKVIPVDIQIEESPRMIECGVCGIYVWDVDTYYCCYCGTKDVCPHCYAIHLCCKKKGFRTIKE